jgi:hypothetical protein
LGRFILIGEADILTRLIFVVFLILIAGIIFIFFIYGYFIIYRYDNNKEVIIRAKREINSLHWRKKWKILLLVLIGYGIIGLVILGVGIILLSLFIFLIFYNSSGILALI